MTTIAPSTILNTDIGKRTSISDTSNQLKAAIDNVTNRTKYATRAELDASGLSRVYDETQRTILNAKANGVTTQFTDGKLRNEQQALKDIDAVYVRFQQELANSSESAGNTEQKANRALESLAAILTRQDGAGRFVFGGDDPYTNPLLVNGNEIDLTDPNNTNVIEGIITNNFTRSAPNNSVVTVSSRHEVKESFLHAGMEAIALTVGYINLVKNPGDATDDDLEAAKVAQKNARGEVTVLVNLELEKVEAARTVNKADIKAAEKTVAELFTLDLTEAAGKVKDLTFSLFANVNLDQVGNNVFQKLLDNVRI